MLIDTFINAIFLYDDKMVITFNYKEGTDTITFDDLKVSPAAEKSGSDLDCLTAPRRPTGRRDRSFAGQPKAAGAVVWQSRMTSLWRMTVLFFQLEFPRKQIAFSQW